MDHTDGQTVTGQVRALLTTVRPLLTPDQIAAIETDLTCGEPMQAVAFLTQFLDENRVYLNRPAFEVLQGCIATLGQADPTVATCLHPGERTPAETAAVRRSASAGAKAVLGLLATHLSDADMAWAEGRIAADEGPEAIAGVIGLIQGRGNTLAAPIMATATHYVDSWQLDHRLAARNGTEA
jgi:hypothetical protein